MNVEERVEANIRLAWWVANKWQAISPEALHDDIESDAMLGLYLAARNFDDANAGTFSTYAVRVIENQIITGHRDRLADKRRVHLETTSLETVAGERTYEIPYDEQGFQELEFRDLIARMHMRERDCLIVWLYYGEGLTHQEIADHFGISAQRIGVIVRTAVEVLRGLV